MTGSLGKGPIRPTRRDQVILVLIALSTFVIFLFDINTKVGMAVGILYVLPILLTLWLSDWRFPAAITGSIIVIALASFFMKPMGDPSIGAVNRPLIILAVSLTGVLSTLQVRNRILLRESNAFNTRLLTESDQIVIKMDLGGKAVLFNRGAAEFTGFTAAEVLGKNVVEILSQGNSSINAVWTAASNALGTAVEIALMAKDGSLRQLSFRLLAMEADSDHEEGMLLLGQDMTARAKAETELSDSKRFLERMLGASPSEVTIYEIESGHIFYQNRALASVLGYPPEQVQAMGEAALARTVFADDAQLLQEQCQRLLRAKDGEVLEVDYRLRAYNGATRWFHSNCLVFTRDAVGRPVLAMRVAYDITEMRLIQERLSEEVRDRILAQNELMEQKERLAVTLRSIGDGVIATDADGNIIIMNPVAEELCAWTEPEASGQPLMHVFDIFNEVTNLACENPVEKVLRSGKVVGLANHTVLRARDGTLHSIADSGAPIRGKDRSIIGVILVFRDVTAERMVEEELTKAARLESVGLLAGGIAHDFNNILSGILGNISMAMAYTHEARVQERLLEAEDNVDHARRLAQQLLTFSRGGLPVKKRVDIAPLVEQSIALALSGSNVAADLLLAPDLCQVEVDEVQVVQALNNVLINAKEAMPYGGKVEIGVENAIPSVGLSAILPEPRYVSISVRDHGKGIPAQNLKHIFEPYFTTKQRGQGLGLTVAYSILDHHEGHIAVETDIGQGSCFTIYLPASRTVERALAQKEENDVPLTGRVLVMDDQEFILEVASEMLMSMGFAVEVAMEGQKAVSLYGSAMSEGRRFDAVIMDLTIPGGMGGKEAVREILALDPSARVLVSSGYSNDPVMSAPGSYGFKGVVPKPYTLRELRAEMQKLLLQ